MSYTTPFTSKQEAQAAIYTQLDIITDSRQLLIRVDDITYTTNRTDPEIVAVYTAMNAQVKQDKIACVKTIMEKIATNLVDIGTLISPNTPAPVLDPNTIYTMPFPDTMTVDTVYGDQFSILNFVIIPMIEISDISHSTVSTDPRIQDIFTELTQDEQEDHKIRIREALAVVADNLRVIISKWV